MIRIFVLALSLISFPVLAQTVTVDAAGSTKFASELVFCHFFFTEASQCYADKDFTRSLSPQDKKLAAELSGIFGKWGSKASEYLSKIAKQNIMPPIDFGGIALGSANLLNAEIDGNCSNIKTLVNNYGPSCKRLISKPLLRLKELSECPKEGNAEC